MMEQVEAQGGAMALKNSLKLQLPEVTENKETVESNPDPVNGPVQTEANGSVQNPIPVQKPVQKPTPVQNIIQVPIWIPASVNGSVSSPIQARSSSGQVPSQAQTHIPTLFRIVVRTSVPAPTNAPALVQNPVENLLRPPAAVQTQVQVPDPVQDPASANTSVSALVQPVDLAQNPVQTQSQGLVSVQNPRRPPTTVRNETQVPNLVQNPAPAFTSPSVSVLVQTVDQVRIPVRTVDPVRPVEVVRPDPSLVRVSLPPEAVRPLSPPPTTTPLKPSVPPLGFRLNGRLIPMLPGTEGLELNIRSHPSGSKTSLTSLHLPFHLSIPPPTEKPHTPIITGESAQKVLNKTPPPALPPPPPPKPKASAAAAKLLRKGAVIRVRPPDCHLCKCHYRPVPELRAFICMCSSDIALSLRKMKMKMKKKDDMLKSKLKKKHNASCSSGTNKSLPPLQKPHPSVSPGMSLVYSPPQVWTPPQVHHSPPEAQKGSEGRLVIRLEDFYYGTDPGHGGRDMYKLTTVYRCLHCTKTLRNNIRLMHHTTDHATDASRCFCSHCLRHFTCPYELQCHLEAVHGVHSSSVVCRICELHFGNERVLLFHMKSIHKPGEMPYTCMVCGFRSSFFSQVWEHFEEVHIDTKQFLCQYCLRVFKQHTSYQQHVARHQKKQVYRCDRCRLQFLYDKDRQEHIDLLHKTHIRPAQISGLRPGTRVTVRTYRVSSVSELQRKPIPVPPKAKKRRAVESLGYLLAHLDRPEAGRCVECLSQIQDFQNHFPTIVQCSLCSFRTCCSQAYANHMIDNHSGNQKCPLYTSIFTSCLRSESSLSCGSCGFSSDRGDLMAKHLSDSPGHTCIVSSGLSDLTWTPADYLIHYADKPDSDSEPQSSLIQPTGYFVPIDRLQPSSHLSVTSLTRPAHLDSPVAMTLTFRGPVHSPKPPSPLPLPHLSILLYSLLCGELSACRRFKLKQKLIGYWVSLQRQQLSNRRWRWDTAGGARWVLTEREQNRLVDEDSLLELSAKALGSNAARITRLNWVVDFLLKHELGIDTRSKELKELSGRVINSTWQKVKSLGIAPPRFCSLDEFPVFMTPQDLSALSPEGLRVWGRGEERPLLEVVLCAASDGTLLRPMLLYPGDLPPLPQGFPTNVLMEGGVEASNWRERAQQWSSKVWSPHLGSDSAHSLLLLDQHCGHMTTDFLEPVKSSGAQVKHIPMGCSGLVQPLDLCVIPVLREFLQVRWSHLVSQAPDSFTEIDLVLTLGCWFSEVCSLLNSNKDIIQRSFVYVELMQKSANMVQRLNKALHHALIQTPHLSTAGQSDAPIETDQSETPNYNAGQSELQIKNKNQSEPQKRTCIKLEPPDQDEEPTGAELQMESQSELEEQQETGITLMDLNEYELDL